MLDNLREYYPTMFNDALAKLLKVSLRTLQRKARELGLDTLVMGIRDGQKLRAALNIPENEEIGAVLALGYADEEPKKPRRRELSDIAKIF